GEGSSRGLRGVKRVSPGGTVSLVLGGRGHGVEPSLQGFCRLDGRNGSSKEIHGVWAIGIVASFDSCSQIFKFAHEIHVTSPRPRVVSLLYSQQSSSGGPSRRRGRGEALHGPHQYLQASDQEAKADCPRR